MSQVTGRRYHEEEENRFINVSVFDVSDLRDCPGGGDGLRTGVLRWELYLVVRGRQHERAEDRPSSERTV
jgi:hypothetical protein